MEQWTVRNEPFLPTIVSRYASKQSQIPLFSGYNIDFYTEFFLLIIIWKSSSGRKHLFSDACNFTNVSLTPKKHARWTWLAKHATMRDGEHICIWPSKGSFLHYACTTLVFEAILEGICFFENKPLKCFDRLFMA